MHNKIASDLVVPLQGDLMPSRWAYEALAVTQFKDNFYEKHFYPFEQIQYTANYFRSNSIPFLRGLINKIRNEKIDSVQFSHNIEIIANELQVIANNLNISVPKVELNNKIPTQYSNQIDEIVKFIDRAEKQFNFQYHYAITKRDSVFDSLIKKYGGRENLLRIKQKYFNKQLADVVTNEKEFTEFYLQNNMLVPTRYAIYRLPHLSNGRAHFYAPMKRLGKFYIDTFWFNLAVIWLYSGLLLIILYFDLLRKVIAYFESLRLNRLARRRFMRLLNITEQQGATKI
jgi:hypothetical protein